MKRHTCRGPHSDHWIPDWVFAALVFLAVVAFVVHKWEKFSTVKFDRHAEQFFP